jgi:hypothetical protein
MRAKKTNPTDNSPKEKAPADVAVEFLQHLRPGSPWVLTAIVPDGDTDTVTVETAEAVEAFVNENNGKRNLYYTVNRLRRAMNKKAAKVDIAAIEYALADLDPNSDETSEAAKARYLQQLTDETFEPKPTAIIDSGNGIQCLWRLAEAIILGDLIEGKFSPEDQAKIDDVEARIKALMLRLGGKAGTQNIDRILRLPGTINLPNAAKLKAGRMPCPTRLISFNGTTYPLEAFPLNHTPSKRGAWEGNTKQKGSSRLPPSLAMMLHVSNPGLGQQCGDYATRSAAFYAFLILALRAGVDENDIIAVLIDEQYEGMALYAHCQEQGANPEDYIRKQIEHVFNDASPAAAPDSKMLIRITSGQRHVATDATQRALVAAKCPVFFRANSLVEPLWRWEKTAEANRDVIVCRFVKLNPTRLSYMVSKHAACYQQYNAKFKRWVDIDPPKDVIEQFLDLGHWSFPTVRGIINSPTLRPDGSLLVTPGYDPITQLWYKPGSDITLPPIPERPTRKDAEDALKLLNDDLLINFPLVGNVSRSVALAGLMTPVVRGAFEFAPLFLITAPEPGTGKTFLVTVIGTLATGRALAAKSGTANKEEMEKRLAAAAFQADSILHLNNLDHDLESADLCQMITEGLLDIRPFGKNDQLIPCDCRGMTIFANGNNIHVVGDLVRRTLTSHLDAKMEQPETRTFNSDPIDNIKSNRGKYLAAVFTIVRAYMAAGCPRVEAEAFGGFEGWSRMVRYPLMWLGEADPVASTKEARATDPQREARRLRLTAILKCFGIEKEFTAADVHTKALELRADSGTGRPVAAHPDLLAAFGRDDGRPISPKSIGKQLAKDLDRWLVS